MRCGWVTMRLQRWSGLCGDQRWLFLTIRWTFGDEHGVSSRMRPCLWDMLRLCSRMKHRACHRAASTRAASRKPERFVGVILRRRATEILSRVALEEDMPKRQHVHQTDTLSS